MDNKQIETLSVNAVKNSIVTCDFLDQFINDNDKEPSWDGYVYIYSERGKRKEDFRGKVPVQVKGTENNNLTRSAISVSVSVVDLKNYLYDGGVVYFVVYIGSDGLNHKIYYSAMPPVKLRRILCDVKKQRKKTIRLIEFPVKTEERETIFLNTWDHCRRQKSFIDCKPILIEDLQRQGTLESITTYITGRGINPLEALIHTESYFYANIEGATISIPIDFNAQITETSEVQSAKITSAGITYYSEVRRIKRVDRTIVKIGESFSLTFVHGTNGCTINYQPSDSLRVLVRDLPFMIAFVENSGFEFDGHLFDYHATKGDLTEFDMENQKNIFAFYSRAIQALDMLNCTGDLTISALTEVDRINLSKLITAFVKRNPVSGMKIGLPPVATLTVGPYNFALHLKPFDGKKGTYTVLDFFRTEMEVYSTDEKNSKQLVSQFVILKEEDFLDLTNLRADALLSSFQKVPTGQRAVESANMGLLHLLKAYDRSLDARKDLLAAAKELALWLMDIPNDLLPYSVRKLNLLQIIRRERSLSSDEQKELYTFAEDPTQPEDVLVGAFLLLGAQIAAQMHFPKMQTSLQAEFVKYPIYRFWNEKREIY